MEIELPTKLLEFDNDTIRSGGYSSPSAYIQSLIDREMRRSEIEQKLEEALDQYERGEYREFTPGDFRRLADDLIRKHSGSQPK